MTEIMAYIFEDYTFYEYLKWLMNYMKLDKRVLYGKECGTLCPHSFVVVRYVFSFG